MKSFCQEWIKLPVFLINTQLLSGPLQKGKPGPIQNITRYFCKKYFYKKMSLKNAKTLSKY